MPTRRCGSSPPWSTPPVRRRSGRPSRCSTHAGQIDLTGWRIADRLKQPLPCPPRLEAGATLQVALRDGVQLGNRGGLITLLDAQGLKVDGVAYTAAAPEGWTVVF